MAEGLTARGIDVTQIEMVPEVLPTVDPELGALVHAELERHGVHVHTRTTVTRITSTGSGSGPLHVDGLGPSTGARGAVVVDQTMATGLAHVWAAGNCVITHHRLLGLTYLPLGSTAHKQGRVAGENVLGGHARFAGSLGTQVVKAFDLVTARTGLREHEAAAAGYTPATTQTNADDHKDYYPGAQPITIRITADRRTGQLLGAQLIGARGTETAKRVDTYATARFHTMTVDPLTTAFALARKPVAWGWARCRRGLSDAGVEAQPGS
jgi:NADPH-dependent 2,4-dienoyl-CoA reductase/sulfur reductase-like enzyme